MSIRMSISLLIKMMVAAVLFGIGVTLVLSVPSLAEHAAILIPLVIVASFVVSPFLSWIVAPTMRSRYSRRMALAKRLAHDPHAGSRS